MSARTCTIEGCHRRHNARGLCSMHGRRQRLYGDPLAYSPRHQKSEWDRFWEKVEFGLCWEWRGAIGTSGYGSFGSGGYAHRKAWELLVGPIPEGMQIDHLCRNTICVNPDHLEPVEPRQNMLRGMAPGAISWRTGECRNGHGWTPENTYIRPDGGGRMCRTCQRRRGSGAAA